MLKRLFPPQANNHYQGPAIALWFFVLITLFTLVRSCLHIFLPDGGAQSIATIPLNSFTPNGAASVILLMSLWGLSQLLMGLFYLVVLWRYRTLIPLMYLLIILEYVGRMLLMHFKPIHITGTAPGHIGDFIMVPLAFLLLILSLWSTEKSPLDK